MVFTSVTSVLFVMCFGFWFGGGWDFKSCYPIIPTEFTFAQCVFIASKVFEFNPGRSFEYIHSFPMVKNEFFEVDTLFLQSLTKVTGMDWGGEASDDEFEFIQKLMEQALSLYFWIDLMRLPSMDWIFSGLRLLEGA